jgi:His/Glu/Gln/Arg/opine family amino acid ABC transporter permease subunit
MPDVILRNLPFLLDCLRMTAELAVVSAAGGTVLGLAVATARHLRLPLLSPILRVYIELVRGTPLLVVLFICYFAIPALLGYRATAFGAACLGFILFIGAYIAEDIRAGLASVPQGIVDAGLASGLRPIQVLRLIVLPQGLRRVIPVLFSQYVRLFKFTSVASVIGVREMTGGAMLINAREFAPITILIAIAASYLVICSAISLGGRLLYQRLAVQS